ncbi:MAG TPA: MDR family MFS transporter [Galbitalea sp.]|jgi:EmrB/QacA subfamily drug resistance transporter|nr:MDR family MFS transporter [Galbitalea sp.]
MSGTTTARGNSTTRSASTGRLLAALLVGGVTAILDTTIVAIGIKTIAHSLHTSIATIQWVSTGYLLALAVAIPLVSWAQSRLGGKRLWMIALGLFLVGSALCATAWNADSLIAFRIIQGLGGGAMLPLLTTLAMQNVDQTKIARTMSTVTVPIALGPILGPVLGGLVLNFLSWPWLFLINVPIGLVGLVLAFLWLPKDAPAAGASRARLDVVGLVLIAPALAALLYGLSKASADGGFGNAQVWIPVVVGTVLLAAFILWAVRKRGAAIIDISLLTVRSLRSSSTVLVFLGAALFASSFLLPLFFQILRGDSVLDAGLLLIPQGVGSLLARFFAGRLVERFGARTVAITCFLLVAITTIPFALADTQTSLWYLGVVLFVRGIGLGAVFIPVMAVAFVDLPRSDMPHASAITRIVQQVGGAFGTALIAVVLAGAINSGKLVQGFDVAFWWTIGITVVAALVAILLPARAKSAVPAA